MMDELCFCPDGPDSGPGEKGHEYGVPGCWGEFHVESDRKAREERDQCIKAFVDSMNAAARTPWSLKEFQESIISLGKAVDYKPEERFTTTTDRRPWLWLAVLLFVTGSVIAYLSVIVDSGFLMGLSLLTYFPAGCSLGMAAKHGEV